MAEGRMMAKPEGEPKRRRRGALRPLVILGVILVLVAGGGWAYVHFWLSRPVGKGPAGPKVPREAFQSVWTPGKVVLLGVGDSVTDGFGATEGFSYFERLVSDPPGEFGPMKGICLSQVLPGLQAKNIAVSGSNSLQHVKHLGKLTPFPSDVLGLVVMTTGGNDIIHNYGRTPPQEGAMFGATLAQAEPWIEAFEKRLDGMVRSLKDLFPGGCHIFLANIYDFTDGSGEVGSAIPPFLAVEIPHWPDAAAVLRAYNNAIARCCEKHDSVHRVNVHDEFLGHGIHCRKFWRDTYRSEDPHYWYHENFEDPNDRGYDAIRRLFLLEMIRVLCL